MARWYSLHLQDRLDGGVDVIRQWGRLGVRSTHPRRLSQPCPDRQSALDAIQTLLATRAQRGYTT